MFISGIDGRAGAFVLCRVLAILDQRLLGFDKVIIPIQR